MNFDISPSLSINHSAGRVAPSTVGLVEDDQAKASDAQGGSGRANEDKFVVRFPEGMRSRLADVAKDRHRSMNAEIVYRMESTLELENEVTRLKAMVDVLISVVGPAAASLALIGKEA